nr:DUF4229 domain-containing protein [Leucobacter edaphi]
MRLLFFAVPFALLYFLGIWPWLAAVFAALIGVSLSIIFLSKPRATASESIYDWRNRDRTADDIVEDDAVESADAHATSAPATSVTEDPSSPTADAAASEAPNATPAPNAPNAASETESR